MNTKLIAKSLFTFNKDRKITIKELNGIIYLLITPKRFIGKGATLEAAITNANMNTFNTGYMVKEA